MTCSQADYGGVYKTLPGPRKTITRSAKLNTLRMRHAPVSEHDGSQHVYDVSVIVV